MELKNALSPDLCCLLHEKQKSEVLFTLINLVTAKLSMDKAESENVAKEIFYREQLMSTGIGLGIGIPHIRYAGVTEPIMAIGVRKQGIPDYRSIDDEVVSIVVMIIVGADQHKQHIRLLSQVVSLLKDETVKTTLLNAHDGDEIYRVMTETSNDE
jgi:mannitol/fructose-specific phosphotransferase system IIA component (Ntr-type)